MESRPIVVFNLNISKQNTKKIEVNLWTKNINSYRQSIYVCVFSTWSCASWFQRLTELGQSATNYLHISRKQVCVECMPKDHLIHHLKLAINCVLHFSLNILDHKLTYCMTENKLQYCSQHCKKELCKKNLNRLKHYCKFNSPMT